jgi:hypothetical protein
MLYEVMLERTETEWAPWTIVEATNKRHTHLKVYETVINALEKRLGTSYETASAAEPAAAAPTATSGDGRDPAAASLSANEG